MSANHAGNYKSMCISLDSIKAVYKRKVPRNQPQAKYPLTEANQSYLLTHLKFWLFNLPTVTKLSRTGSECKVLCGHDRLEIINDDYRRTLPSTITAELKRSECPWQQSKVTVCWIICYLADIHSDEGHRDWKQFQCSHKCITQGCISINHQCWESASNNQSRGHTAEICLKRCTHCNESLCHCQNIHSPACI
jgi:hypothetical protein